MWNETQAEKQSLTEKREKEVKAHRHRKRSDLLMPATETLQDQCVENEKAFSHLLLLA